MFTSIGGTFIVAGCDKCSPRVGSFTFSKLHPNVSVGTFPDRHSCIFKLGITFWVIWPVVFFMG